eukprot:5766627-Pyramimonas_sp.AAC.1
MGIEDEEEEEEVGGGGSRGYFDLRLKISIDALQSTLIVRMSDFPRLPSHHPPSAHPWPLSLA